MSDAPGEGEFTLDADRVGIGRMITQMVWSKLFHFLEQREFHNYRFLLNSHAARYFRALDVEPIDGLIPGFRTRIDPSVDDKGFMLDRFLHQNGFRSCSTQKSLAPKSTRGKVTYTTNIPILDFRSNPSGTSSSAILKDGHQFASQQ